MMLTLLVVFFVNINILGKVVIIIVYRKGKWSLYKKMILLNYILNLIGKVVQKNLSLTKLEKKKYYVPK